MKCSILITLAIALCISASPVYAWPEPKNVSIVISDNVTELVYNRGGWPKNVSTFIPASLQYPESVQMFQPWIGRWPSCTEQIPQFTIPPQLNSIQAIRWFIAYPAAKPRLAQLYGVSDNVAEQYGAYYLEIRQLWED